MIGSMGVHDIEGIVVHFKFFKDTAWLSLVLQCEDGSDFEISIHPGTVHLYDLAKAFADSARAAAQKVEAAPPDVQAVMGEAYRRANAYRDMKQKRDDNRPSPQFTEVV